MTEDEFEYKLQKLIHEANQEEIPIDYIYSILIVKQSLPKPYCV